jgi:tetratricopeptide (TPR) repeat protein
VTAGPTTTDFTVLPLALLDDASVDAPLFVPAAYVDGFRLLADAKYPEALASLRAAATASAGDERARVANADMLVAAGDRAAAGASLRDTVGRFPLSGQAQWRLGRLSEDGGDQKAALRSYEAAARCAPVAGAAIVYAAIGRLHHTALDLQAAARAYERRVTLTPGSTQAHLDLGTVYQAQDRLDDALAEYLAAALVDPASASAFASAGQLRADQGDDAGAIALLRSAVRLDARHGAARYALGRALLRTGRADEARQELAAFETIQKAEMDAQRRQFEENSRAIESALQGGAPKGGK